MMIKNFDDFKEGTLYVVNELGLSASWKTGELFLIKNRRVVFKGSGDAKNKTYYNKDDVLLGLNWTANVGTKATFNPADLKHIRKLYKNEYHYLDDYDKVMGYCNP